MREKITFLEHLPSIKYGPELVDFHLYQAETDLKAKNITHASKHVQTAQKYFVEMFKDKSMDHHPKFATITALYGLIRLETSDYDDAKIHLQEP